LTQQPRPEECHFWRHFRFLSGGLLENLKTNSSKMVDLLAETKLFRIGFYFAALIASIFYVLWKIIEVSKSAEKVCKKLFVVPAIGFLSLALAWIDIYKFISELSRNYPDLKTTLKQEEVVVEVWGDIFYLM